MSAMSPTMKQVEFIRASLDQIRVENGMTSGDVFSMNFYLASMSDLDVLNAACVRYFSEPYPVRRTIAAGLGEGARVEMNAQARAT
jgi:enamine deaminase RidA (YjgF/YER057c/UK114 family)